MELPHIQLALRELGPRYAQDIRANSQFVKDLYAPALIARGHEGITVTRDISYGDDPRQVLDVFRPVDANGADVVAFVHGGAFVRGARSGVQGVYDNVLYWFARQGLVGVNVEYRLAPQAPYPQGALDVAAALEWVHQHIASHGGRAARVLLVGHSAGGTHAASYLVDPAVGTVDRRAAAAVLVSARLRADTQACNPNADGVRAYFGDDPALYEARSPVTHAGNCAVPVMIAVAEFDNPLLDAYGLEFAHRLAIDQQRAPRVVQCQGHNHMSIMAHFDSGEETLGREILQFWSKV